ncbi:MAG TPA: hypothetical protein VJA66_13785, partial [Thermoanaerobaculia bacterium]
QPALRRRGLRIGFPRGCARGSMSGIDVLLRAADQALYQAKERGKNRCIAASVGRPVAVSRNQW